MRNQLPKSDIFIKDLVLSHAFQPYERFLDELVDEKTRSLFVKPSVSNDVFSKDIKYKMGYIQAIKDIINLNEEAKK